jgi:uncharacterized protein (TIGR00369 family)
MTAPDPAIRLRVDSVFSGSPFCGHLGIELLECTPGHCLARLPLRPELLQMTGYAHAGVVGTLADQCAGGAAMTLVPDDCTVVTVEFKINLLRPAVGDWLLCRATVLKPGRRLSIAESEVLAERADGSSLLVAKLTATLAVIPRP